MHKRRVLKFFMVLLLFGMGLFSIQKSYFGGLTGNVVSDFISNNEEMPFSVQIGNIELSNSDLIAKLNVYSQTPRNLKINLYVYSGEETISSKSVDFSSSGAQVYTLSMDLSKRVNQGKLIVYVSDGENEMQVVKEFSTKGITGSIVSGSVSEDFGIWAAFLVFSIILLIVIIFGLVFRKNRKQTNRINFEQTKHRFIKIDVN